MSRTADFIGPRYGANVVIESVRWPQQPWEVANKSYADFVSGVGYTYVPPMHRDDIALQVYVDDADLTHKGVLTLANQTIVGDKHFTGDVYAAQEVFVAETIPSSSTSAVTLAYVNQQLGSSLTVSAPLQKQVVAGPPQTVNLTIDNAVATSPGVISGAAQTLGGDITLTGNHVVAGLLTVSGASMFTGVATFTNTAHALTDLNWTAPSDQIATGTYVRQATLGAGYDAGNGWISDCKITIGVSAGAYTSLSYHVAAGCFRFSKFPGLWPGFSGAPGSVIPECGPVVTHAAWAEKFINVPGTFLTPPAPGASQVLSVYITQDPATGLQTLIEDDSVSATNKLYANYIQIGALVLLNLGPYIVLAAISNVKIPFADHINISQAEIATLLCPVNMGPNVIYSQTGTNPSPAILLHMAAGGFIWEYGANGADNPTSRHMIPMPEWRSYVEGIYPVWQDDTGNMNTGFPPVGAVATSYWNPLAAGTQLSTTTAGKWYNSPILYNPSAAIFMQQYPTAEFTSSAAATEKAHSFTRMYGGASRAASFLVCLGVVTFEAKAYHYIATWNHDDPPTGNGSIYPTATLNGDFWIMSGTGGVMDYPQQLYAVGDWFAWNATTSRFGYYPAAGPAPTGTYQTTWDVGIDGTTYPVATNNGDFWQIAGAGGTMGFSDVAIDYDVGDWFAWNTGTLRYDRVPFADPIQTQADYSNTILNGGEYFNYQAAGGSGGGGSGGGGGGSGLTSVIEKNTAWLQAVTCTTTGVMNEISNPFSSYGNAVAQAALVAVPMAPALIHLTAGHHTIVGNVSLRPFVSVAGFVMGATYVDMGGGNMTADVAFATVPPPPDTARVSVRNLRIVNGGIDYDLFAQGGSGTGMTSVIDIYDIENEGATRCTGREAVAGDSASGDQFRFTCCVLHGTTLIDGGNLVMNNVFYPTEIPAVDELVLQATKCRLDAFIIGSLLRDIHIYGPADSSHDANITISSSFFQDPTNAIHIDYATTLGHAYTGTLTLSIDRGSVPFPATVRMVYNRADAQIVVNVYDEEESQDNLIYLAGAGNDVRSGLNLNNSVLTLPRALEACTLSAIPPDIGSPYTVLCQDASMLLPNGDNCTVPKFCSIHAPSATMEASMTIKAGSRVQFKDIYGAGAKITMAGGDASDPPNDVECRFFGGKVTMDASQPALRLTFGFANSGAPGAALVTATTGSSAFLSGDAATGLITADGVGAFVDVSGVRDLRMATFLATSGGWIRYPPNFGATAEAIGVLKGTVGGVLVAATPGSDFLAGNQMIALSGNVTGSGYITDSSIAVTIKANNVTASMIETSAEWSILGKQSASAGTPFWFTDGGSATARTVVMRDAYANVLANHAVEAFGTITGAALLTFTATTPAYMIYSGTGATCNLPAVATITNGFKYTINNTGSGPVIINSTTLGTVGTVPINACCEIIWDAGAASWKTVTLLTGSSIVPVASLTTAPAWSVLANQTAGTATPTYVTGGSANTLNGFVARDASGNFLANHVIEGLKEIAFGASPQTLGATDSSFVRVTSGTGALRLPATASLATGISTIVYNGGVGTVTVADSSGGALATMTAGEFSRFVMSPASVWTPYPYYQVVTLTGAVSGSGSRDIATSIVTGQVPFTGLPQITGPVALGRLAAGAGDVATVTSNATTAGASLANAFVHRDAAGNSLFNHAMEPYTLFNVGTSLAQTSPAYFQFSSAAAATMTLPATANMATGFKFSVWNSGAGLLDFVSNGGSSFTTIPASSYADIIWNGATWVTVPLLTNGSTLTIANLATIGSPSVLGNISGASAVPTTVPAASIATTASTIVYRNTAGNFAANHAIEPYALFTTGASLTDTSPAYFQFSKASNDTMTLPATGANTPTGFKFSIYNAGAGNVVVNNSSAVAVGTVLASSYADVIWDGVNWVMFKLASQGGAIAPAQLTTAPAWSILANQTAGTAAPVYVTGGSANTVSGFVARDTAGNFACAHASQSYGTLTSNSVTLAESSPAYFQYSGAGTTYFMPPTANLTVGYKFSIFNNGSAPLLLDRNGGGGVFGTVPATSYADSVWDGTAWKCFSLASLDNATTTYNITIGSKALVLNGACTTTGTGTVDLIAWTAGTTMVTSGSMLVEYSAICVATNSATTGAFTGSFRAIYSSVGPLVTIKTPFISEIKDLDAGVNTCKITALAAAGVLKLQANGQSALNVEWTGQMRVTYRTNGV